MPGDPVFDKTVDQLTALIESGNPITCSQEILNNISLRDYVAAVLRIDAKNYSTPHEFLVVHGYFFADFTPSLSAPEDDRELLQRAWESCFKPEEWTVANLHTCISDAATAMVTARLAEDSSLNSTEEERKAKKETYKHLRAALADGQPGPGIADMMEVLGRDRCLGRMMKYVSAVA